MKSSYDVIVVGAGPAGSTAARYAAKGGASVLLLERDREPGIPVRCAEGLSHAGLEPFIKPDPAWISRTITSSRFHAPDGSTVDMTQTGTGYVVERRLFDNALCVKALDEGAEMLVRADAVGIEFENDLPAGVRLRHMGAEEVVRCRIVIGADGIESRVARMLGVDSRLALNDVEGSVQYTVNGVKLEEPYCHFHFGRELAPGGYLWVFPKRGDTANIGLGVDGTHMSEKPLTDYLDRFLERHYPGAKPVNVVYGGIPTARTLSKIAGDGFMLAGDAARQVNPITGGGIINAIYAGWMAGQTAAEAIQNNDVSYRMLKKYQTRWKKKFGANLRVMYEIKEKILSIPDAELNHLIALLRKIPPEKFTPRELFMQAIRDNPVLVAKLAASWVTEKLKN